VPAAPFWQTVGARDAPSCRLELSLLTAVHRMRNSEDFSVTVRRGVKAGRMHLVVHVLPDATRRTEPEVGFVVSRAVGSAVVRNRVKRQLRHLMQSYVDRLPPGCRVVVRALPPAGDAPAATLNADLEQALQRAGAW
jgi:ribonuclease P protein component